MNPVQAWNDIPWTDVPLFLIFLIVLYWVKKTIDLRFARKQSKVVYNVRIVEDSHINIDHGQIDEIVHNHVEGKVHTHEEKW